MSVSRFTRFTHKPPGSFVKPSIPPEARAIRGTGNCCWNCSCIIAIVFMRWNRDEPTRRLLMLVEQRRHWVEENKRHSNRLSARLKVYFPQVVNWFEDVDAGPVLDLLTRWPSLEQLQKAQRKTLEAFLRQHR